MILLLAGTSEAKQIAWGLADMNLPAIASFAGVTHNPATLPVPTRIGGFGGASEFRAYVQAEGIRAVIDATHPFASQISDRSARVCADLGVPFLHLRQPKWKPGAGDTWIKAKNPAAVTAHLPLDACVFLATGRQSVVQFAGLEGRRILVRVIDPPTAPLPFEWGEYVIGRPPFSVQQEVELFRQLGVTHLVVKNAGGSGGMSKLVAARELGLSVIMIKRPSPPAKAKMVRSVQEVLTWVSETVRPA